jgi:hypothetical protein
MSDVERSIFELIGEISPTSLYSMGLEQYGDEIWIPSRENLDLAISKIREIKARCAHPKDELALKYLESIECMLERDEPQQDMSLVLETLVSHLIKEGVNVERLKKLVEKLTLALDASLEKHRGRKFPSSIKILTQYMVLSANEIIDVIQSQSRNDQQLLRLLGVLREKANQFGKHFAVEGFTDGQYEQVATILKRDGAGLGREKFYPRALRYGFDYSETPTSLSAKRSGGSPRISQSCARQPRNFRRSWAAIRIRKRSKIRSNPNPESPPRKRSA